MRIAVLMLLLAVSGMAFAVYTDEQYLRDLAAIQTKEEQCKDKPLFGYENVAECILDKMPGVKNDQVAIEVYQTCQKKSACNNVKKKRSNLFFGPKNSSDCVMKYAEDTTSPEGAGLIRWACSDLYK